MLKFSKVCKTETPAKEKEEVQRLTHKDLNKTVFKWHGTFKNSKTLYCR